MIASDLEPAKWYTKLHRKERFEMRRLRVYADTSVFGGCLDDEFAVESKKLFDEIREGKFILEVSPTTVQELQQAPDEFREMVAGLPSEYVEVIESSEEIDHLRDAYLEADIVGPACLLDAEHIASASVADVDIIVSWNFKHIVHHDKIRGYHGINLVKGYESIPIHTPREVVAL
jgi:hypothetical protein